LGGNLQAQAVEAVQGVVEIESLIRKRKDGPVVSSDAFQKSRGSKSAALLIAKDDTLMANARDNLSELIYAHGTVNTKNALFDLWSQIAIQRGYRPLPITPQLLLEVAAVLRAAKFRSAGSYILEAKQRHERAGHVWDEQLRITLQDAKRAVSRGIGPATKAEEVRPELWQELWMQSGKRMVVREDLDKTGPGGGVAVWGFGSAFLLREVELACLTFDEECVKFDWMNETVTVSLTASKKDPAAGGAKRTLSCNCKGIGSPSCPFCAGLALMRFQSNRLQLQQDNWRASLYPLVGQVGDCCKFVEKEALIKAAQMDVAVLMQRVESSSHLVVERVTGHFMRRSGAKSLARKGVPYDVIQWMARHSSDATRGYVEEALAEAPMGSLKLQMALSIQEQLSLVLRKADSLEAAYEKIGERMDALSSEDVYRDNLESMREEIHLALRPLAVVNLATFKVHSNISNSFLGPPVDWQTHCGWQWVRAGRLAKPILNKGEVTSRMEICKLCRHLLQADGYLEFAA
jgi:hypothetical protein